MQALRTIDAAVKVIAVAGVHAAAPHDGLAVAAVLPRPFRAEQLLGVLRRALGD